MALTSGREEFAVAFVGKDELTGMITNLEAKLKGLEKETRMVADSNRAASTQTRAFADSLKTTIQPSNELKESLSKIKENFGFWGAAIAGVVTIAEGLYHLISETTPKLTAFAAQAMVAGDAAMRMGGGMGGLGDAISANIGPIDAAVRQVGALRIQIALLKGDASTVAALKSAQSASNESEALRASRQRVTENVTAIGKLSQSLALNGKAIDDLNEAQRQLREDQSKHASTVATIGGEVAASSQLEAQKTLLEFQWRTMRANLAAMKDQLPVALELLKAQSDLTDATKEQADLDAYRLQMEKELGDKAQPHYKAGGAGKAKLKYHSSITASDFDALEETLQKTAYDMSPEGQQAKHVKEIEESYRKLRDAHQEEADAAEAESKSRLNQLSNLSGMLSDLTGISQETASAFQDIADVFAKTADASGSMGDAFAASIGPMGKLAASFLKNERDKALLRGFVETGESIAAFASGNIPGGVGHAAAAAAFFVAAGKGGGVSVGSRGIGAQVGSGPRQSDSMSGDSSDGPRTIVYNISAGVMDGQSVQRAMRRADASARGTGWEQRRGW